METLFNDFLQFIVIATMRIILSFLILMSSICLTGQAIEVYDSFDDFEAHLVVDKNKIYVINFWATWCAPCIKELPHFEEVKRNYSDKQVEVVLVSIDFKNQYESRLIPFLNRKKLTSRVIHMADPKSNIWVDKVDPSWSGAIPATLFVKSGKRVFLEKEFPTYASLQLELEHFINK